MDPKELKENFLTQLEKAQNELNQLRQALSQREALVLKLQGAVEAMTIQLPQEATEGAVEEVPLAQAEVA